MNEVSDQVQRQRALNPAESFIIQAPAGSGKTELLIQRYLRMLSLVDAPEEIIAITFTRKAAAEMRARIIAALELAQLDESGNGNAVTFKLSREALQQDARQGWDLCQNTARLRIQTIDSLTASLTRQMPILSRFGAQPETLERADELYRLAAARTLAELESGEGWSEAIAILLQHLDNDLPRVRTMLAGMLARRDQWMRHVARQEQRQNLEAALGHLVQAKLEQVSLAIPAELHAELIELLHFAAANLQESESDSLICSYADRQPLPEAKAENLDHWRALGRFLLTNDGNWRKQADVRLGFPPANASKSGAEERAAMKNRFKTLLGNLSENANKDLLQQVSILPDVFYSDSDWELIDALYQLLKLADAQLRLIFAERNQMDFSGITQAAIDALGNADEPSELAMQLDYRIRHILVDEFQDISINQYVLLERLTAGWSEEDQHSLFVVGDPMQSIYRFREAEVALFLNTWQQKRLYQLALVPLAISVNFRSHAGIVNWVNSAFTKVLPAKADLASGAVRYAEAEAYHSEERQNPVRIHPMTGRDDQLEAETVAKLVVQSKTENPGDSIAILVRNRSHLVEVIPELVKKGIAYRAVDIESMGQQTAVQDLLALTLGLTHLADRAAWLAILRAPWCGLRLTDLSILLADSKNITVWDCLQDSSRLAGLSDDAQQRLQKLLSPLQAALSNRGRRRLRRWLESAWMGIGGPASLPDKSDLKNCKTFFALLDEFDNNGELSDRGLFQDEVASLYAATDVSSDNQVQIMTMHKAKGLEFDTVILPGLSRRGANDEARLLMWMETPHAEHQDLLLAPIKHAGQSNSSIYDYLRRLENDKQYYEQGRLLYVAVTRARKALHILASAERKQNEGQSELLMPPRNSLSAQLWPVLEQSFRDCLNVNEVEHDDEIHKRIPVTNNLRRLKSDWKLPSAAASRGLSANSSTEEAEFSALEFEWAGETIKHVGTVVHRCIQWLGEQNSYDYSKSTIDSLQPYQESLLLRLGVVEDEIDGALNQVQLNLQNMFSDPRGQWLFSGEHRAAKNEYAISGMHAGKLVNAVIDRTFIDEKGVRWIIDYKTSRHEGSNLQGFLDLQRERYQQQLEKYAQLMLTMEDRPVKLALYFPMLQGWREWRYQK